MIMKTGLDLRIACIGSLFHVLLCCGPSVATYGYAGAGETCTVVTESTSLNVRTFDGKVSGSLGKGAVVVVKQRSDDGRAQVAERRNGKFVVVGWVSADYLNCSDGTVDRYTNFLITPNSVGDIRLGMTIEQARMIYKTARFRMEAASGKGVEVNVYQGDKLLITFATDQRDATDGGPVAANARIESITIDDPRYKTAEGVYPKMLVSEVEKRYGKVKKIEFWGLDASEHAEFSNQLPQYAFDLTPPPGSGDEARAGVYSGDETETTRYVARAVISAISLPRIDQSGENENEQSFDITSVSAGNVRLGMTVAEARSAMKGATFERTSDGEGVALISVKQGGVQLMTLFADEYEPQSPIDDTARIINIEVWDQRFKTAAGIHPNMKLVDVEKILGKVTKIITSEIEAREYADFTAKSDGFIYRLMGPDSNAGIYPAGTRETSRYVANAYIYTISIAQERSPDAVE